MILNKFLMPKNSIVIFKYLLYCKETAWAVQSLLTIQIPMSRGMSSVSRKSYVRAMSFRVAQDPWIPRTSRGTSAISSRGTSAISSRGMSAI